MVFNLKKGRTVDVEKKKVPFIYEGIAGYTSVRKRNRNRDGTTVGIRRFHRDLSHGND
jgi:hypothetical protein